MIALAMLVQTLSNGLCTIWTFLLRLRSWLEEKIALSLSLEEENFPVNEIKIGPQACLTFMLLVIRYEIKGVGIECIKMTEESQIAGRIMVNGELIDGKVWRVILDLDCRGDQQALTLDFLFEENTPIDMKAARDYGLEIAKQIIKQIRWRL